MVKIEFRKDNLGFRFVTKALAMIFVAGASFFAALAPVSAASAEDAIRVLSEQNNRVLSGRVHAILKARFEGLRSCPTEAALALQQRFASLPVSSETNDQTVAALQLFLDSKKIANRRCQDSLNAAENDFHEMERKNFRLVGGLNDLICSRVGEQDRIVDKSECGLALQQVLAELDPHCVSVQVSNPLGYYDGFPCMAGDILIGRDLYEGSATPEDMVHETRRFFARLRTSIADELKERRGPLEMYLDYAAVRGDSKDSRRRFTALMTMIMASTNSYSSYIKGFHDYFWRAHLLRTGDPRRALELFNSSRLLIDEFRTLADWSKSRGIPLFAAYQPLSEINRHDFMAAALTCHYGNSGRVIRKWFPVALGYAYESFDFVSHLKEGTSVRGSIENFRRDTGRYRKGVAWGAKFCDLDPSEFIYL